MKSVHLDAPRVIHGEIVEVAPIGREIVPRTRESALPRPVLARSVDEPEWFAREFPQDARAVPWRKRDEESQEYYRRAHAAREGSNPSLPLCPDGTDSVTLWEQYHFLKALATRLDAGRGTLRDRQVFEAGLSEFNRNFDAIRARKALPGL